MEYAMCCVHTRYRSDTLETAEHVMRIGTVNGYGMTPFKSSSTGSMRDHHPCTPPIKKRDTINPPPPPHKPRPTVTRRQLNPEVPDDLALIIARAETDWETKNQEMAAKKTATPQPTTICTGGLKFGPTIDKKRKLKIVRRRTELFATGLSKLEAELD